MRSSFIRLFPHGRCYSLHFYYFYIQEILPGTMALASFSLCFCVPASSLLFCHYHRFFPSLYYHTFYSKLCFSFSGMRSCLIIFCCLMADVFYCFVAVVYHEGILIYLFSRHEKFFYSFVPSWSMLFIAFLLLFIRQRLILGTIALVFRFAFTDI